MNGPERYLGRYEAWLGISVSAVDEGDLGEEKGPAL